MDDQTPPDQNTPQPSQTVGLAGDNSPAMVILNLENLIRSHLGSIDTLEEELTKHSEMLNDIFEADPTYKDHADKAKEASRVKSQTKQQILKQPQAADLDTKVKAMKSELADTRTALADYVREYARLSGLTEITGDDGEVREIVYTAKLVKKN